MLHTAAAPAITTSASTARRVAAARWPAMAPGALAAGWGAGDSSGYALAPSGGEKRPIGGCNGVGKHQTSYE